MAAVLPPFVGLRGERNFWKSRFKFLGGADETWPPSPVPTIFFFVPYLFLVLPDKLKIRLF